MSALVWSMGPKGSERVLSGPSCLRMGQCVSGEGPHRVAVTWPRIRPCLWKANKGCEMKASAAALLSYHWLQLQCLQQSAEVARTILACQPWQTSTNSVTVVSIFLYLDGLSVMFILLLLNVLFCYLLIYLIVFMKFLGFWPAAIHVVYGKTEKNLKLILWCLIMESDEAIYLVVHFLFLYFWGIIINNLQLVIYYTVQ